MSKLIDKRSLKASDKTISDTGKGAVTAIGISIGAGLMVSGLASPPVVMMGGVALMLGSFTIADAILMARAATKALSNESVGGEKKQSDSLFCSKDGMQTHLSEEEVEEFLMTDGQSKTVSQCSCQLQ